MDDADFRDMLPDPDPEQTLEWQEAIRAVSDALGQERAHRLLLQTIKAAREEGLDIDVVNTPYLNTIHPSQQPVYPGDLDMERRIHGIITWNAMMMVTRANKANDGIGGHISTFASNSHLWEVGQNHYYRGKDLDGWGDHVYWQGHASPGIYSRAWLEGRLTRENIDHFRMECDGVGLSSYPHPRLMPEFWEYPSVSMGLGSMTAIHTARFNRYLSSRGLTDTSNSRVWYTMGDGESDEPESLSQLTLASRENLGNMIMIMNCNLQRLDGPVRGNSKIVQELEGRFRGSGWNVIKVLWGSLWDDLFARDSEGVLADRLQELVDGDEQRIFTSDAKTFREELFNTPSLKAMVSHLSDDDLEALASNLGGHDMVKINAAYAAAQASTDKPTIIFARTIKGYGLGPAFAGRNSTHGKKKADFDSIKWMRDDLGLSFTDKELEDYPFIEPSSVPDVVDYVKGRRKEMGGFCPERRSPKSGLTPPGADGYSSFDEGTKGEMQVSTTMAFVRLLSGLMKDKSIGKRIVPIVPDEARTFGMDPLFAQFGIYHPEGQLYTPVDHKMLMKYKESETGQLFEEGISEAGAMSTFIASATSYSTQGCATIPFYIFYSMFGFQRVADLIWSAADQRARGFMIGATSGRTTLNGEGLQHQDGHSLLMAHTNPAVRGYDPAFAYELATIIRAGIDEMYVDEKDVLYYIAVYNENHPMPPKPKGSEEGIIKGMYKLRSYPKGDGPIVRLIGSGPIMLQLLAAVEILETYGVRSEIYSATSYGELRREGLECERINRLNPSKERKIPYIEELLGGGEYPTIAVSDNQIAVPDMIRQWVGGEYTVLGTDGFGRSDTRQNLRKFFEIDAQSITIAALSSLVRSGEIENDIFDKALISLNINKTREDITSL